jgi:tRNA threonylcarbamoyladenosine biosynthesis protein TsaB
MRVLAVDSTTERESVALVHDGDVQSEVRFARTALPSRQLLPAIEFLLQSVGSTPEAVDGYAVTIGPGSFTGLRVGISTVQGLALALARPCLGVSTLDVLAARITGTAPYLVPMMEGGRGQVYAGLYDEGARPLGEGHAEEPARILEELPRAPVAFVGDAVDKHRDLIRRLCPGAIFPPRSLFLAGTLGQLAFPRLAAGEGVAAGALRPLYLRDAHIRPSVAPPPIP